MNEDTSQFIDYLSNAGNGNNVTGMSEEESLLLSPILQTTPARKGGRGSTAASGSLSSFKRTRSSARLRRRQMLLNVSQHDEDDYNYNYNYNGGNDTSNGTGNNHGGNGEHHEEHDGDHTWNGQGGDRRDLNMSIPEHHVVLFEDQNANKHSVFSPQARVAQLDSQAYVQDGVQEVKEREKEAETEQRQQTLLYGALDTSACPSLGLGSIGTDSSSMDSNIDQSHDSVNASAHVSVPESNASHTDATNSATNTAANTSTTSVNTNSGASTDKSINVFDNNHNTSPRNRSLSDKKNAIGNNSDDSGLSFDSESSSNFSSEGVEDYFQPRIHHHEAGRNKSDIFHASSDEETRHGGGQEEDNTDSRTSNTPFSSHGDNYEDEEIDDKRGAIEEVAGSSSDIVTSTDSSHSHKSPMANIHVTQSPIVGSDSISTSVPAPTLASALLSTSTSTSTPPQSNLATEGTIETTPPMIRSCQEDPLIMTPPMESTNSSVTPLRSIMKIRKGLTPRLKALRNKMIVIGTDKSSEARNKNEIENRSFVSDVYMSPNENDSNSKYLEAKTPNSRRVEKKQREKGEEYNVTPVQDDETDRLSLTPALKAFRMKLMNSTLSPLDQTPHTQKNTVVSDSLSPSLRPSTSTILTSGGSSNTRRVMFEEDASYLREQKDLSSAKKNLNAHSSALVEHLRGAAYKRVMSITRSRDSLAAKENLHFEKHEENEKHIRSDTEWLDTNKNGVASEDEYCVDVNEIKAEDSRMKRTLKSVKSSFKSLHREEGYASAKKQVTIPISSKLGVRREKIAKSGREKVLCDTKRANIKDNTRSTTNQQNSIKAKRRPITIPKSPLLGARRKAEDGKMESSKSSDTEISNQQNIFKSKRRPLTIPKSPLLGGRRKTEDGEKKSTKSSNAEVNQKLPSKASPSIGYDSPLGLGFLAKAPCRTIGDENVAPFTLHSSIRAKERAQFEACRLENEKLRNEEIKKERERILGDKYRELGRLREKLR